MKSIIKENPIFVTMLGLCPALAVTNNFEKAYMMGISVIVVLLLSGLIVGLIKKIVPDNVKIPVYIVIIGTFVTILEMILAKFIPNLYSAFSIYLSLLVVNCIVLGTSLSFKKEDKYLAVIKKSFFTGVGFALALCLIAIIREVIGSNTITIIDSLSSVTGSKIVFNVFPTNNVMPISLFAEPAGAFIVLGILMGTFRWIRTRKGGNNESN